MTIQQLEYYQSSAILKNFSRAAQYHFVSESTLSRQISSLENELGVSLFDRGARGVELTHAGYLFFRKTMEMFQHFGEFRCALFNEGLLTYEANPFFRIACHMEDNVYPQLVKMLEVLPEGWNGRQYKIDILRDNDVARAVLNDTAHVGIDLKFNLRKYGPVFDMRPFATSPIILLVGKTHELADRSSIGLSELLSRYSERDCYFLPDIPEEKGYALHGLKVKSLNDILTIRKILARLLPLLDTLRWLKCPDNRILIPPAYGVLSEKLIENLSCIKLTGIEVDSEGHVVFWKKEMSGNSDIECFLESLAFK